MAQLLMAFSMGVLLAPWGSGLFFLVLFIVVYEIIFLALCGDTKFWVETNRPGVILASILGWMIGREAVGYRVLKKGVPKMVRRFIGPHANGL